MTDPDPAVAARILIVEDDPVQATLISELLAARGYATTWKRTLSEGAGAIRAEAPDLLLLDRILPDGDGITLCRELKADPALLAIPVILLTARDQVADRVEGLLVGADDYISKPFHAEELLARVHGCLRTLSLQRELQVKAEELEEKNQALVAAQARLVRSERLAAIGEIGLAIRHEINNPLGTILGFTELLLSQAEDLSQDVQRKLEAIRRASLRIRDVVRRLEGLRKDRTVEYVPGMPMTDLRVDGSVEAGEGTP
ncbi:MAG TPA: response regulator [Candidatus Methylomirabilis sp.]|nr:response regulator [Candidatus Methylomirabilis sp.]